MEKLLTMRYVMTNLPATLLTNTLVQTYSSVVCSYFGVRKMISFMAAFYSSRRPGGLFSSQVDVVVHDFGLHFCPFQGLFKYI